MGAATHVEIVLGWKGKIVKSASCRCTSKVQTGLLWSTWVANGTMQEIPVGSVLLGRLQAERRRQSDAQTLDIRVLGGPHEDGVCMTLSLALRRKSALPPMPFSMREPSALVELAWA